jgi:hypothetical protein
VARLSAIQFSKIHDRCGYLSVQPLQESATLAYV